MRKTIVSATKAAGLAVLGLLVALPLDLGAAWTSRRLSSNAGTSDRPDIAVAGPAVFTVWSDYTPGPGEIYFKKSADGGATWQGTKRLTSNAGDSYCPRLAVDGANVYVVWEDDTPGKDEIFFRKSPDGGANWTAARRLSDSAGRSARPFLKVDGKNIYVVWFDNAPGNDEVYFRKSTDGGASWAAARRLTANAGASRYPRIAVRNANLFLVWNDDTPGNDEIYFRKSADGGANWTTARKLSNNAGASFLPEIAVYGTNLYVVWNDETPGNLEVYFRKSADGGASWSAAVRLTNTPGTSWLPTVAVSGAKVHVAWMDDAAGNNEIYYRRSVDGGAAWETAARLTNHPGYSYQPRLAVGGGFVYVVRSDAAPGNFEVYASYAPLLSVAGPPAPGGRTRDGRLLP